MRTVTAKQMKELDDRAINVFGIPALCLMENAGRAVADHAADMLRRSRRKTVAILCGAGNNGGDGFVAARHLLNKGLVPVIIFSGDATRMKEAAAVNFEAARRLRIRVARPSLQAFARAGLIIDAFFGVGLSHDLEGCCRRTVEMLNASGVPVLAVDVPSGLDATTGRVRGACVKAKRTVTFAAAKKGLVINDGPAHAGRVVVVDIGIPLIGTH